MSWGLLDAWSTRRERNVGTLLFSISSNLIWLTKEGIHMVWALSSLPSYLSTSSIFRLVAPTPVLWPQLLVSFRACCRMYRSAWPSCEVAPMVMTWPLLRRFAVAKSHGGGGISVTPRRAVETHRNSTGYFNWLLKYLLYCWWIVKKNCVSNGKEQSIGEIIIWQ
jgi:hypothetical protein